MLKKLLFLSCLSLIPIFGFSQSTDFAVSAGGVFSSESLGVSTAFCPLPTSGGICPEPESSANSGFALEGDLAHRLFNAHLASLHLELPVVGIPKRTASGGDFSSLYFTPGLRLRLSLPLISPFVSAGGGFAHFSTSSNLNASRTTGAFDFGGGVDVSTPIPLIGLRGEVRDFFTGVTGFSTTQHNVFVGAGIVLKF